MKKNLILWLLLVVIISCGQTPKPVKGRPAPAVRHQSQRVIEIALNDRFLVDSVVTIPPVKNELDAKCFVYFKIGGQVVKAKFDCVENNLQGRFIQLYKAPIHDNNENRAGGSDKEHDSGAATTKK